MEDRNGMGSEMKEGLNGFYDDAAAESALLEYWRRSGEAHCKTWPKKQYDKMFLKGPVPILWLSKAARLGGKCLHIGVVIWTLSGLKRSRSIRLEGKWLTEFGVRRGSAYRNLKKLRQAGLIELRQKVGCCPRVTIITGSRAKDGGMSRR